MIYNNLLYQKVGKIMNKNFYEKIKLLKDKKLKGIIFDHLLNSKGKLEAQRLSLKYFKNRANNEDLYYYLRDLGITSSETLYCVVFNKKPRCNVNNCDGIPRFNGLISGYKDHCLAHSSVNRLKQQREKFGDVNLELSEILQYVKLKNGKYSTSKIKNLSEKSVNLLIERTNYLENVSISERLYHLENEIHEVIKCLNCGSQNKNFISSIDGYKQGCSRECNLALVDLEKRNKKYRSSIYEASISKFENKEIGLDENYNITVPSKKDYIKNPKNIKVEIEHKYCGRKYSESYYYQGSFTCPYCFPRRARSQKELFEFIKNNTSKEIKYDDRKFLNGLEIDILIHDKKLAIEYSGINFHSFGVNSYYPLNNAIHEKTLKSNHLNKTELVEEKGYQLFQIFSNEYDLKKDIWNSVILNKIGKSKRIYARECRISTVSNHDANIFLEENHLQGKCKSSIRIGLYFKDELVSLMTFGKSRYNKKYEYELIRYCSKLNTSVIGGASKLLKNFESEYNPASIISYANRRWSNGNLYNVLGFNYVGKTNPNYFYFKTGSNILESRLKFQKHKLRNLLENFDQNKTETENMYNNGYRKIYDCGNLVFVKKYI